MGRAGGVQMCPPVSLLSYLGVAEVPVQNVELRVGHALQQRL